MLPKEIPYPGLTPGASNIPKMVSDLARRQAAYAYKQSSPCPWVVFLGGTGTGKSTLFNAFCGQPISDSGVERPKTSGPIVYSPVQCTVSSGFPVEGIAIEQRAWEPATGLFVRGHPGRLLVLTHEEKDGPSVVAVDTPDLDSVEGIHREIADDFYLLSDIVVFVTSQEKYADEVPSRFLAGVMEDGRPLFFLLNKAQGPLLKEEIVETLKGYGVLLVPEGVWLIPYEGGVTWERIREGERFRAFVDALSGQITSGGFEAFQEAQLARRARDLRTRAREALHLLQEEVQKGRQWTDRLARLCSEASLGLLEEERHRFVTESGGTIQREVKKLFSKYDVLAKPRQFVRSLIRAPLEVLGLLKGSTHYGQKEALSRVRSQIAFEPILRAIDHLNRTVLAELSPKDEGSPLFHALRKPHVAMAEDEIKSAIMREQDGLDRWLEDRFQRLSHDLPRSKKWGIYSTSILWGVLILSFEIIVGGGFTVLDAALDSVIAPFVTKGAVELFASREIRSIARELAKRYEDGLLSVIAEQKKRYGHCLQPLLPTAESLEPLKAMAAA